MCTISACIYGAINVVCDLGTSRCPYDQRSKVVAGNGHVEKRGGLSIVSINLLVCLVALLDLNRGVQHQCSSVVVTLFGFQSKRFL